MICNKCNKEIPEQSTFCNFCGNKIIDISEEKSENQKDNNKKLFN